MNDDRVPGVYRGMGKWVEVIADGIFLFILGCSATGAVAAVYQIVYNWRRAWKLW